MIVDTVRLSEKAKNQLIQAKRKTGIEQWNVLCRWALMLSLREDQNPPVEQIKTDSSVEMTWKTFAGTLSAAITSMVRYRYQLRSPEVTIEEFFTLNLHRGISYLNQDLSEGLEDLFGQAFSIPPNALKDNASI